jgi:hypothetical protein
VDNDLYLKNKLEKILGGNGNLAEAISAFNAKSSPEEQSGMIALTLQSFHEPSCINFWEEGVETNNILLEILRNLKSAGYDEVRKPLENYCNRIHELKGIRDEQGNLSEIVKQHLMFDVGLTLEACKRRSYPPKEISLTHWRRSL